MTNYNPAEEAPTNVLASLRSLTPSGPLTFQQSLALAEGQAEHLLSLADIAAWPVPSTVVATLPRIAVVCRELPTSGISYWNGESWIIVLNTKEPLGNQRFTLLHEFKHIVDHGLTEQLYGQRSAGQRAERAADYFAACVLLPRRLVERHWNEHHAPTAAQVAQLARVSPRAVAKRLQHLGLTPPFEQRLAIRRTTGGPGRSGSQVAGVRHRQSAASYADSPAPEAPDGVLR